MPWRLRLAGAAAAVLTLGLLASAGYGFVLKSLPYHTPQLPPPDVRLTAADLASLASYPAGITGVPVLTWRDVSHRQGDLVTTPVRFASELAVLRRDGFRSIGLAALAALAAGRYVALPARPIMLTFDDGLSTDWTTVDPILRRYGFTAVVFISPGNVALKSPSYFLTSGELRAMAASGRWDVGLQIPDERATLSTQAGRAPESLTEWRERTSADARRAQRALAVLVGSPVTAYAWPVAGVPSVSDTEAPGLLYPVLRRIFAAVFARPASGPASYVVRGSARAPLPRLEITAATSLRALSTVLRTGVPSPPPADPSTLPWRAEGGRCQVTHRRVVLTVRGFGLCAITADGSQWRNYQLRLDLRFVRSADITVLVELRVAAAGRVEVAIGRSGVSIKQLAGRRWSVLRAVAAHRPLAADGRTLSFLRTGALPVSLRLAGRVLAVRAGKVTLSVRVGRVLEHGVIALGLVSPAARRWVSFRELRIMPPPCAPASAVGGSCGRTSSPSFWLPRP